MQALVHTSLRLRPDVITMAEMRGAEALDTQETAHTGHTVTSTLHANNAKQTYRVFKQDASYGWVRRIAVSKQFCQRFSWLRCFTG